MAIWRKLRAILGMGLVWALGWVPLALGSVVVISLINGRWPNRGLLAAVALEGAISGALSGVLFGSLLALTGRRSSVQGLSARRVAALGVLSGMVPTGLLVMLILFRLPVPLDAAGVMTQVLVVCGGIGAVCAGGVLYLARRAPALPEEGDQRAGSLKSGS